MSSDSASQKGKSKRRKDRKHRKNGQWHYSETDNRIIEQYYVPTSPYNVLPMQYGGQCCTPTNYPYANGPSPQEAAGSWANEYNISVQAQQQTPPPYLQQQQQSQPSVQSDQYYNNQWQPHPSGYDVAPGAPMPITIECTQYPGCMPGPQGPPQVQQQYDPCCYPQQQPQSSYYPPECYPQQQEQYSQPSTSYQCYELPQQPGLPPGAKIVAEYFLGYLDEQQTQQYQCQQYPQYAPPQTSSESSKEDVEVERWEKPKKQVSSLFPILIK